MKNNIKNPSFSFYLWSPDIALAKKHQPSLTFPRFFPEPWWMETPPRYHLPLHVFLPQIDSELPRGSKLSTPHWKPKPTWLSLFKEENHCPLFHSRPRKNSRQKSRRLPGSISHTHTAPNYGKKPRPRQWLLG